MRRFAPWDGADYILDAEDIRLHLAGAVEDDDGDGRLILATLDNVARSKGLSALARKTGLDRASLYKALSPAGNPTFATLLKVTRALGLRLRLEAVEDGHLAPEHQSSS